MISLSRHRHTREFISGFALAVAFTVAGPATAATPTGRGVARRAGTSVTFAVLFNVTTFTFLIRTPNGTSVAGFVAPHGFGCGVDPDGALRCVGRQPLRPGRVARGRFSTRSPLNLGTRLRLTGFANRGAIGPFPITLRGPAV